MAACNIFLCKPCKPCVAGAAKDRQVDAIVEDAGISDLEYLKSRMRQGSADDDEEEEAGEEASDSDNASAADRSFLQSIYSAMDLIN